MNVNDFVSEKVKKAKEGYKCNPETIIRDFRIENESTNGYLGRQVLELLQNAVDEMHDYEGNRQVKITFSENKLVVSNTGNTFTEDGILSLMRSHLSPKYEKNNYIGKKGTGFKSILSWAKEIRIYSESLSISYSENYVNKIKEELFQIREIDEFFRNRNEEKVIPILPFPEIIEKKDLGNFATTIEIIPKENLEIIEDIKTQINNINSELLLFLNSLNELHIDAFGCKKTFHRSPEKDNKIIILIEEDGKEPEQNTYVIKNYNGSIDSNKNENQEYFIQIAYKEDGSLKPSNLYSYFKTDIYFPLPIIVNASFNLTADRNHITDCKTNRLILEKISEYIFEIAKKRTQNGISNYDILKTFLPRNNFESLAKFKFYESYIEKLKGAEIYPTIDGKYKRLKDLVLFRSELSRFLDRNKISNVLLYTNDENILSFISKEKQENPYSYENIISSLKNDISENDKCRCLFSLYKEYSNELNNLSLKILDKEYEGKEVFLQATQHEVSEPPQWANIIFLKDKYKKELIELFKESENRNFDNRDLASILKIVKEYNFETIAKSLCESGGDNIKRNKEFILWLYNNKREENYNSINKLDIKLLSKSKILCSAKDLYLCEEIENLCPQTVANRFADIDFYKEHDEDFKSFLTKVIGVNSLLRDSIEDEINDIKKITDWFLCSKELKFPMTFNYYGIDKYSSITEFETSAKAYIKVQKIDLLKEILENENNSTEKILNFLFNIYDHNNNNFNKNHYTINCIRKTSNQRYHKTFHSELLNYNLFLIKTTKWVKIDGKKYAPEELVLSESYAFESKNTILKFLDLEKFKGNRSLKDLKDLFLKFGVNEDFSVIPIRKLYNILNEINNKDSVTGKDKRILKKIYNTLIDPNNIFFSNNYYAQLIDLEEFNTFSKNGNVLCKNSELVELHNVFYEDHPSNREDINFIDIPYRRGSEKIKNRLCIERFEKELKVKAYSESKFHNDLSRDFEDFKIYAYAYRMRKNKSDSELKVWKNLTIKFCDTLSTSYDEEEAFALKDYQFVYEKKEYKSFLKIPNEEKNINLVSSAISDIILYVLDITDEGFKDKCTLLFISSEEERKNSTENDYIDLDEAREKLGRQSTREEAFNKACNELGLILSTKFNVNNISKTENLKILCNALNNAGKDISDFNLRYEYEEISLVDYYLKKLKDLHESKKELYANFLYLKYKDKKEDWDKYYKELNDYDCYNYKNDIKDSVSFDPTKFFYEKWDNSFRDEDDRKKNWKLNKNNFEKEKDKLVLDEFENKYSDKKLLYLEFGVEKAEELFEKFIKEKDYSLKSEINVANGSLEVPKKDPFYEVRNTSISLQKNDKLNNETSTNSTPKRAGNKSRTDERNEKLGKDAETFAYVSAIAKYGDKNVKWVSEYAKKANVNPDGEDGLGYDLWYKDKDKIIYVEVKSQNFQIHMSSNEYKFATEHKDYYEVWLVDLQKNEIGIIKDITDEKRYPLIPESYIIKINKESVEG